ncbi:acyl-CoA N-acyltransferase [Pholiota molesta]|nr:acyl-CoA N-acyltransferase [Pholiota molesta]
MLAYARNPSSLPPLPSIRIRYYRDSDADRVRYLFKDAICVGADSPRANLCRSELKTPRAFASCALLIFGAALYLFSRTQQMRVAAALLLIAGPVQFLAYFARTYATFMAFVNGSINGPEMMDVPTAYGLVRSTDGGFIPKGTNAFWVAEAYSPEDPSRVEVVGCVGLDVSTRIKENNAELRRLAVSSRYRGRGIARLLNSAVIARAREYGLESVYLRTSSSNFAALKAYRKLGWVVEQEYANFKNLETHVLTFDLANSAL